MDIENREMEAQFQEVENVNVDYEEQTLQEKVFLGMETTSNPLFTNKLQDNDIVELEVSLSRLREENRRLNHLQTNLIYANREKIRQIEELSSLLKDLGDGGE